MLKGQYSPLNSTHTQAKSGRKPLQPRNIQANTPTHHQLVNPNKPKPQKWIEISLIDDSNKENNNNRHMVYAATPTKIGSIDVSLAEELSAIRLKLERMRLDKEETEKMLRERDLAMEAGMKELVQRGEIQKMLEIEVDRLFRLKELKSSCMRKTPIRSLRERQQGRNIKEEQSQDINAEDATESIDESPMRSPISEIHSVT
ncbi:hypothetical protein RHMOL_Rhmol04G0180600 [Rhododendron molle]|uniref:Uncharacterized protein n=1 Tax=Rhododendron molle TaxID=49168 RepID=A0ACC0P2T7_RHOML|nr:hypothetical protein RHMOL_Rhmol04G0180600 [Rhododendron molle]